MRSKCAAVLELSATCFPLLSAWVRANANGCEKYVLPSSIFSLWGGQAAVRSAGHFHFIKDVCLGGYEDRKCPSEGIYYLL